MIRSWLKLGCHKVSFMQIYKQGFTKNGWYKRKKFLNSIQAQISTKRLKPFLTEDLKAAVYEKWFSSLRKISSRKAVFG
jgi:hypothetical protein